MPHLKINFRIRPFRQLYEHSFWRCLCRLLLWLIAFQSSLDINNRSHFSSFRSLETLNPLHKCCQFYTVMSCQWNYNSLLCLGLSPKSWHLSPFVSFVSNLDRHWLKILHLELHRGDITVWYISDRSQFKVASSH